MGNLKILTYQLPSQASKVGLNSDSDNENEPASNVLIINNQIPLKQNATQQQNPLLDFIVSTLNFMFLSLSVSYAYSFLEGRSTGLGARLSNLREKLLEHPFSQKLGSLKNNLEWKAKSIFEFLTKPEIYQKKQELEKTSNLNVDNLPKEFELNKLNLDELKNTLKVFEDKISFLTSHIEQIKNNSDLTNNDSLIQELKELQDSLLSDRHEISKRIQNIENNS